MEPLLAVLLGAAIATVPVALVQHFLTAEAGKVRALTQARETAQQTYITELQNRLSAHTWGEFAQLQNEVDTSTAQAARVLNSFGETRAEEAFGESAEDIAEQLLAELGDYEGPTIG